MAELPTATDRVPLSSENVFAVVLDELGGFRQLAANERTWRLAADAQAALAADPAVSHRVKPIDLLLAAVADQHGVGACTTTMTTTRSAATPR